MRGKYIQFKILVHPYEDNQSPISLDSIRLSYLMDASPQPPMLMSVVPGSGTIKLTWMPTTEDDVIGYEVYYGTHEGNYICGDSLSGKSPIFIPFKQSGKLKTIEYVLQGMRNEVPYFIAIKAVDANGNRSVFSKEAYARPSTVYNGAGFSIGQ
ncbi:MAG: fibronectin type III domain-containing protein [Brevinematales bacterium]|nr:fibronectin type III domain-containing protein [Brevinematales bacterium]